MSNTPKIVIIRNNEDGTKNYIARPKKERGLWRVRHYDHDKLVKGLTLKFDDKQAAYNYYESMLYSFKAYN